VQSTRLGTGARRTDTFKEATKRATVVGRDFYLAEKQQPRPQA
jgi:hypothetical protein